MLLDKLQYILFTALTGFIIGFLATFFGLKISKALIVIGVILLIVFYLFLNGNFELDLMNLRNAFTTKKDLIGEGISSIRGLLMKNVPLTVGVIFGVIYGFKKA